MSIVGTWKLISIEGAGFTVERLGTNPIGILYYDELGNMMVQIMRTDRPPLSSNNLRDCGASEIRRAFEGYVAYFGAYEVDERQGIVTHHVKGNLLPNDTGSEFRRRFRIAGNELRITTVGMFAGERLNVTLTWERLQ